MSFDLHVNIHLLGSKHKETMNTYLDSSLASSEFLAVSVGPADPITAQGLIILMIVYVGFVTF